MSGYTGPGSKTINPAHAAVKLDFRLVPGQRPLRILSALKAHLRRKGFGDIEVIQHSTFEPGASPVSSPIGQALMAACQDVYGRPPAVFPWMGGSSSTFFYTSRGTPAALPPGVGYSGSLIHAPNEHIRLEDARRAIKAFAALMLLLGSDFLTVPDNPDRANRAPGAAPREMPGSQSLTPFAAQSLASLPL